MTSPSSVSPSSSARPEPPVLRLALLLAADTHVLQQSVHVARLPPLLLQRVEVVLALRRRKPPLQLHRQLVLQLRRRRARLRACHLQQHRPDGEVTAQRVLEGGAACVAVGDAIALVVHLLADRRHHVHQPPLVRDQHAHRRRVHALAARRIGEAGDDLDGLDGEVGARARERGHACDDGVDRHRLRARAQAEGEVEVVRCTPEEQVAHIPATDVHRDVAQVAEALLLGEVLEDEGEDQPIARRDQARRQPRQIAVVCQLPRRSECR